MATKRKPVGKGTKSSAKAKPKRGAAARKSRYGCPNKGKPMSLSAVVAKIISDAQFATFIRDLLRRANRGDKAAGECLTSYFQLTSVELESLCMPGGQQAAMVAGCTDCTDVNQPT